MYMYTYMYVYNVHVHVHVVYHTNDTNCYYNLLITQNMDTHTHTLITQFNTHIPINTHRPTCMYSVVSVHSDVLCLMYCVK